MRRVVLTRWSRADLIEILLFIRRDNRGAAKRLLDTINNQLELLSEFPGLGPLREELAGALRSFPVGATCCSTVRGRTASS